MKHHPSELAILGETTSRNNYRTFGIKEADRRTHAYIIGKTGTGKTSLLESLIGQDIRHGRGVAVLDPHGDLIERVLAGVPQEELPRLIYMNVPDASHPVRFNPIANVPADLRSVVAAGILDVFRKLWEDSWGPRLEHILRNSLLALLEQPDATLSEILLLIGNKISRREMMHYVTNEQVRSFWLKEFEQYPPHLRAQAIAPVQNKVGAFLADRRLNAILTSPRGSFDLRNAMDSGKVILVNLAKGKIGQDSAELLGSLIVAAIGWTALTRADQPEPARRDFHLYLDECHTFSTPTLINMMAELRKYRVSLTLAHQHVSQFDNDIRDAILGNVGTLICFRLGPIDAPLFAKELAPEFDETDLTRLPNFNMYVRMPIDGNQGRPFSARTALLPD